MKTPYASVELHVLVERIYESETKRIIVHNTIIDGYVIGAAKHKNMYLILDAVRFRIHGSQEQLSLLISRNK